MIETTNNPDLSIKKQSHEPMTHEESMNLPFSQYFTRCQDWLNKFNDGKPIKTDKDHICPIAAWVNHNHGACGKDLVGGIKQCEICGEPICPDCSNHGVTQLSRVTGYIQDVAGERR